MMRKWQVVGIEIGSCEGPVCENPNWLDEFIYFYDRYTPNKTGLIFEEVGSWQKAWPSSARWLTEEEMENKYGEPIPFPTCQNDCIQAPPGTPGKAGETAKDDPFYFNNPWLPEIIGGEIPENIEELREKNLLGGSDPLDRVHLPVKLFWWNIPGWHEGWIENENLKKPDNDPENIAYIHSYIIRFDNVNREDRPVTFYRHEVVNRLIEDENTSIDYIQAQSLYERLLEENHRSYERYRRYMNDSRSLDTIRYDRDNIIGCDDCGWEKEIWLKTNTFNPLEYSPLYDYERKHRDLIKEDLLERFSDQDPEVENLIKDIIIEAYNSYGRPGFFRSGAEHHFTLQASCYPHDYLEEGSGRWGPEARFSFQVSDAPELISPLDPNWVSPYDPKKYDPEFSASRLKFEDYGYDEGYQYPAEKSNENYLEEFRGISYLDASDLSPLWNRITNHLFLQNEVAFREEFRWTQQWYQTDPGTEPRPPRTYLLSFGEGIKVLQENIDKYGNPVLEDCHNQLIDTFGGQPICTYTTRPRGTHETYLRYPLPNYLDREFEFFTLPEAIDRDIYSWNVSACRDLGATDCTDFSQMWRFQLDQREEERIFPPRNSRPLDINDQRVSENEGTVGFPFSIRWERRFGARSYVFRIAPKEDVDIENDIFPAMDARITRGEEIRYFLEDLENELFELNTSYLWDVKACWDDRVDHDKETPQEIIGWAEENKQCSDWSSEYYDSAPFKFKTTGRPPHLSFPTGSDLIHLPINFEWEEVPGAKGYIFFLQEDASEYKLLMSDTVLGNIITENRNAVSAKITPRNNLLYDGMINLYSAEEGVAIYHWQVASCASPIEEETSIIPTVSEMNEKREKYNCGRFNDIADSDLADPGYFFPFLPAPINLSPGNTDDTDPTKINIDNSQQVLRWDSVETAKNYLVTIGSMDYFGTNQFTVENNYLFYNFDEQGRYYWNVRACLDDCENFRHRSQSSESYYLEVIAPQIMGGVVPCGRTTNIFPPGHPIDSRESCRPVHLLVMMGLIIENILVKIIIPYSLVLLLLYTGYLYYTGLGDPKTMQTVFKIWEYALKGYLLIILAWFIIGIFLSLIGYQFGIWWDISVGDIEPF